MRKLITTKLMPVKLIPAMALLVLIVSPAAIAQTGSAANPGGLPSAKSGVSPIPAPVGHRQPRVDQVPPEKDLGDPNDPINREDAALNRKIKSICRGC